MTSVQIDSTLEVLLFYRASGQKTGIHFAGTRPSGLQNSGADRAARRSSAVRAIAPKIKKMATIHVKSAVVRVTPANIGNGKTNTAIDRR